MKWILVVLIAAVYLLHQDFWNWTDKSLVFGFLPKGLAYHAGYSFLAAAMMWILVKAAWPEQLERSVPEETMDPAAAEDAH